MASKTDKTPAPEVTEGAVLVDNTDVAPDKSAPGVVAEEYELTEGLVQVNYV